MTNDEIRTMKDTQAILICGHHQPIMARLKPYYRQSKFKDYSNIEAPVIIGQLATESIPVLPLKQKVNEQKEQ